MERQDSSTLILRMKLLLPLHSWGYGNIVGASRTIPIVCTVRISMVMEGNISPFSLQCTGRGYKRWRIPVKVMGKKLHCIKYPSIEHKQEIPAKDPIANKELPHLMWQYSKLNWQDPYKECICSVKLTNEGLITLYAFLTLSFYLSSSPMETVF